MSDVFEMITYGKESIEGIDSSLHVSNRKKEGARVNGEMNAYIYTHTYIQTHTKGS